MKPFSASATVGRSRYSAANRSAGAEGGWSRRLATNTSTEIITARASTPPTIQASAFDDLRIQLTAHSRGGLPFESLDDQIDRRVGRLPVQLGDHTPAEVRQVTFVDTVMTDAVRFHEPR